MSHGKWLRFGPLDGGETGKPCGLEAVAIALSGLTKYVERGYSSITYCE